VEVQVLSTAPVFSGLLGLLFFGLIQSLYHYIMLKTSVAIITGVF